MRSLTGSHRVRPRPDQRVDRPEVEAPQGVQLTGTNRPRTYHTQHTLVVTRPLCGSEPTNPPPAPAGPAVVCQVHSVTAAMARGKRPVTFRTRKLSLSAPMVLPWGRGGRVGRRRTYFSKRGSEPRAPAPVLVCPACPSPIPAST